MSLTVQQKTNIHYGRALDYVGTTVIEKADYLIRHIGRQIAKREIAVSGSTEAQIIYWKSHSPHIVDNLTKIEVLDKITDLNSVADDELVTVTTEVLSSLLLSYSPNTGLI